MTILYVTVAGILGFIFLGLPGAVIGGLFGIVFGASQSNHKRIVQLEKEMNELKKNNN